MGKARGKSEESSKPQDLSIRIQWYRSTIGASKRQKELVRSLGLTRLNQVVERPDTPSMRGAVAKAPHLLRIVP